MILRIVLGAVTIMALGFVWYHPKTFGAAWMRETGMTEEKAKQGNMAMIMGLAFLMSLIIAYRFSGWLHPDENYPPFLHGAFHAGKTALFLVVPALVTNALFEQKSWTYILINAGYWLVGLALAGGVIFSI